MHRNHDRSKNYAAEIVVFCFILGNSYLFITLTDFVFDSNITCVCTYVQYQQASGKKYTPKEYKAATIISTLIHHESCRGLHVVFTHGLTLSFSALGSWLGKLHNKSGLNVSDICFLTSSPFGKCIENTVGYIFLKTKFLLFQRKKGAVMWHI